MMYFTKKNPVISAAIASTLMLPLVLGMFLTLEPTVAIGQNPNPQDITITQQVNEEIAFTVAAQDVTMDTQIQGISGGTSNGSTTFEVTTNNTAGYTVTIGFASSTAMEFNDGPEFIPNLGSTVRPNFTATTTGVVGTSAFAYTVTGPDVASDLLGDTSSCGSGSASADACWKLDTDATVAYTMIDSGDASDPGGDTYDLYFRVVSDANPNPSLPQGFYTATATLTAINK